MGVAQSRDSGTIVKAAIGFDPKKMDDKEIKLHCATKFGGDPVQTAACIDGIVKMRGQESCKTVDGVTQCTKIVSAEFNGGFTPGFAPGLRDEAGDPKTRIVNECTRMYPNDPTAVEQCFQKLMAQMNVKKVGIVEKAGVSTEGKMMFGTLGGGEVFTESIGAKIGKVAEGYCAEGSVCGTPMYGHPLWVWVLALVVILLALQGLKDR